MAICKDDTTLFCIFMLIAVACKIIREMLLAIS